MTSATLTDLRATVNSSGPYYQVTAEVTACRPKSTQIAYPQRRRLKPKTTKTATSITYDPEADLELSKSVSPANAGPDDTVTFTITLTNHGPNEATNVEVTDQLPSGYSYVSDNPSQGTYNNATGVWDLGSLANNDSATLTITATVNSSGPYTNTAEVTASDQNVPRVQPPTTTLKAKTYKILQALGTTQKQTWQ